MASMSTNVNSQTSKRKFENRPESNSEIIQPRSKPRTGETKIKSSKTGH